jgi:hypothetical protein
MIIDLDEEGGRIADLELISSAVIDSSKEWIEHTVVSPTYKQLRP